MSEDNHADSFDLTALWSDLQDLEDDSLTSDKREALTVLLDRSPAARRAYLEYFHQAAVLRMEADKFTEKEQLANIITPLQARAWWSRPWTAAVAAVVILVAALSFLLKNNPTDSIEQMRAVASTGSQWEINDVTQGNVAQVKPGNSIRVLSGTVKFELQSGSTMVMQGPCQVKFSELRKPLVQEGLLWIDTGSTDDAFEVSTSELVVRDIGTRFGVRASQNNRSEIHLHEGGVNVVSRESGIDLVTLAATGKGHAITADGSLTELALAEDPFPALQSLLSGGSMYRSAILAQNPISYVKFDGGIDGRYDNEVRGRRTVKSGPSVTMNLIGVNEDERFRGFELESKSLYLPANEHKTRDSSVVAFLDGSAGISQQQGSVTFWIKQADATKDNQVLWMACKIDPQNGVPASSLAYTNITADGHVEFTLVNGDKSEQLSSNHSIRDGQWHHVGITWGSGTAGIYLDGKQAAQRSDVPDLEEWFSYGNFVRFGKPTDELYRQGMQNFHGWLDEFAVWNRALTPQEIANQYKAAIGNSEQQ